MDDKRRLEILNNPDKKIRLYGCLILGILLIGMSISFIPNAFTFKSSLISIKGTLRNAKNYVETVTDRRGNKSQVSELIFYLNEQKQEYYLAENIEDLYVNKIFEKIEARITNADTVTIWIKKNDVNEYRPEIFQIDADSKVVLDPETVRTDAALKMVFCFILGLISISLFFVIRFPDAVRKLLKIK